MPQKKVPTRSKIIVAIVAFLATLYAVFVGVSYLKSWNDFKPYHKLAVELNEGLGGGYTIKETKNCGLDTSNCPSVRLIKDMNTNSQDEAKKIIMAQSQYFSSKGYEQIDIGICEEVKDIGIYCSISAVSGDSKLKVTSNVKHDFIGIDITR